MSGRVNQSFIFIPVYSLLSQQVELSEVCKLSITDISNTANIADM
jgi:hypothetical protein